VVNQDFHFEHPEARFGPISSSVDSMALRGVLGPGLGSEVSAVTIYGRVTAAGQGFSDNWSRCRTMWMRLRKLDLSQLRLAKRGFRWVQPHAAGKPAWSLVQ
jgi:hypothetical protein